MARITSLSKLILGIVGAFFITITLISVIALRGCGSVQDKMSEQTELNSQYLGKTVVTESGKHTLIDYKVYKDVFVTDNRLEIDAALARSMTIEELGTEIDTLVLDTIQ